MPTRQYGGPGQKEWSLTSPPAGKPVSPTLEERPEEEEVRPEDVPVFDDVWAEALKRPGYPSGFKDDPKVITPKEAALDWMPQPFTREERAAEGIFQIDPDSVKDGDYWSWDNMRKMGGGILKGFEEALIGDWDRPGYFIGTPVAAVKETGKAAEALYQAVASLGSDTQKVQKDMAALPEDAKKEMNALEIMVTAFGTALEPLNPLFDAVDKVSEPMAGFIASQAGWGVPGLKPRYDILQARPGGAPGILGQMSDYAASWQQVKEEDGISQVKIMLIQGLADLSNYIPFKGIITIIRNGKKLLVPIDDLGRHAGEMNMSDARATLNEFTKEKNGAVKAAMTQQKKYAYTRESDYQFAQSKRGSLANAKEELGDAANVKLVLQEQINDRFYGVREIQTRVEKAGGPKAGYGIEIRGGQLDGGEMDVKGMLERFPGSAAAGLQRERSLITDIAQNFPNVLGHNLEAAIVLTRHIEVLGLHPKRVIEKFNKQGKVVGKWAVEDLTDELRKLEANVGPEGWRQLNGAMKKIEKVYGEERMRFVAAGLMSEELANYLAKNHPHYSPTKYLDEGTDNVRIRDRSNAEEPVIEFSEKTKAGELPLRPLAALGNQLIKNETMLYENGVKKAIILLAKEDWLADVRRIMPDDPTVKLPKALDISKPSYKNYTLQFESDVDKALFIVTQRIKSTHDKEYMDWLARQLPDMNKTQIRAAGMEVRKTIGDTAIGHPPGDLAISFSKYDKMRVKLKDTLKPNLTFSGAEGKNTITFYEKGVPQVYEVPEFITREINYLSRDRNGISKFVGATNGISRAAYTSFSPAFVAANIAFDMITVMMTRGVLPHEVGDRLMRLLVPSKKGTLDAFHEKMVTESFYLAGGYSKRFLGKDPETTIVKALGLHGDKPIGSMKQLDTIKARITRKLEAGEQAPRMEGFKTELDDLLGEGWETRTKDGVQVWTPEKIAASWQGKKAASVAQNATLNFYRGGAAVKNLDDWVIFLNASLEGLKLPFRTLRDNPASRSRLASLAGVQMGVTSYNMSYPEYWDIPHEVRYGSFFFMLPSTEMKNGRPVPNYIKIIPKLRDLAIFAGAQNFAMESLYKGDLPGKSDFFSFGSAVSTSSLPVVNPTDILFPLASEVLEQYFSYDLHFKQDMIPPDMQLMETTKQVKPYVSRTIQEIAEHTGQSPKRLEHAASGLFGGAYHGAVSVTDWIVDALDPYEASKRATDNHIAYLSFTTNRTKKNFLRSLRREERTELIELLNQPDKDFPILGPVVKRFFSNRGGQQDRDARKKAAKEAGIDLNDTFEVMRQLNLMSDNLHDEQKQDDERLGSLDAPMQPGEWRAKRRDKRIVYESELKRLQGLFGNSAQALEDPDTYFTKVLEYTEGLSGEEERNRMNLHNWYSIDVEPETSVSASGLATPRDAEPDLWAWRKFFQLRDVFKTKLGEQSEDQLLILGEQVRESKTKLEREYMDDMDPWEPNKYYINSDGKTLLENPGIRDYFDAGLKALEEHEDSEALIKAYNILIGSADPAAIKHHYDYGLDAEDAEDIVENAKRQFRKDYPVIEMKLYKWGFLKSFSSPINDSVEEALQALRTKHNDIIKQPYLVETMYQGPDRDQ